MWGGVGLAQRNPTKEQHDKHVSCNTHATSSRVLLSSLRWSRRTVGRSWLRRIRWRFANRISIGRPFALDAIVVLPDHLHLHMDAPCRRFRFCYGWAIAGAQSCKGITPRRAGLRLLMPSGGGRGDVGLRCANPTYGECFQHPGGGESSRGGGALSGSVTVGTFRCSAALDAK